MAGRVTVLNHLRLHGLFVAEKSRSHMRHYALLYRRATGKLALKYLESAIAHRNIALFLERKIRKSSDER